MDDQRRVAPGHFLIAFLPLVVFVGHDALVRGLGVAVLPLGAEAVRPGVGYLEAAGRWRFLTGLSLFGVLVLVALAVFADDLARPMTRATRAMAGAVWLAVIAPVLASVHATQTGPEGWSIFYLLGPEIYDAALGQGRLAGCDAPGDRYLLGACGPVPVVQLLRDGLDVASVLAALGVAALAVGMVLCLRDLPARPDLLEARVALLQRNMAQMRRHLYLAGVLLTSGMFFAISWMHWPLPLIEPALRDEYRQVVRSVELMTGTYFSLLILSFFVPVAFLLDRRVRALARQATRAADETARRAWLEAHGLRTGLDRVLKEALAVVAPLLAAVSGGFAPI